MKPKAALTASLLSLAILLMAPISTIATGSEATDDDCADEWVTSTAARTCLPTQISVDADQDPAECGFIFNCVTNMDCTFDAPCDQDSGAVVDTGLTWQGSIDDVSSLKNCSGTIQTHSCN